MKPSPPGTRRQVMGCAGTRGRFKGGWRNLSSCDGSEPVAHQGTQERAGPTGRPAPPWHRGEGGDSIHLIDHEEGETIFLSRDFCFLFY